MPFKDADLKFCSPTNVRIKHRSIDSTFTQTAQYPEIVPLLAESCRANGAIGVRTYRQILVAFGWGTE